MPEDAKQASQRILDFLRNNLQEAQTYGSRLDQRYSQKGVVHLIAAEKLAAYRRDIENTMRGTGSELPNRDIKLAEARHNARLIHGRRHRPSWQDRVTVQKLSDKEVQVGRRIFTVGTYLISSADIGVSTPSGLPCLSGLET